MLISGQAISSLCYLVDDTKLSKLAKETLINMIETAPENVAADIADTAGFTTRKGIEIFKAALASPHETVREAAKESLKTHYKEHPEAAGLLIE